MGFVYIRNQNADWFIFVLAILLGSLFLCNTRILPLSHIRHFTFYKSEPVIIRGVVTNFPQFNVNFSSFVLNVEELIWADRVYPVCGKVLVRVFRKENIAYADRLILEGRLFRPYQAKNNQFSYREYLENQGIYSVLSVSKGRRIGFLGKAKVNFLKLWAYKAKIKAGGILYNNLKPIQAGIMAAMILGERSRVPGHLRRLFVHTGTVHILAISGLHVGIIGLIPGLLFKSLGIRRRIRYLLVIIFLVFYCILTGARPPVIRATIMAIILLLGFLLKREVRVSYSISLAALIILMINPWQLFNKGFQLSFISVISVIYLSRIIRNTLFLRLNINRSNNRVLGFFLSAFCISLSIWLGTFLLVAYYFRIISPVSVLANIAIVPYLVLVVAVGFSVLIFGIVFPVLLPVFSASANLAVIILIQMVKAFNQIPWAYFYL